LVHVIKNIKRPAPEVVKAVAEFPPATLHEAQGRRGALDWRIKPIADGMRFCGPALTVRCTPGDNLMLAAAISIVNHPVVVGGVHIEPGDLLVGDDDGVVLVRAADAQTVARASREREDKEARFMDRLRAGENVTEVLGMDRVLAAKGCTWES
jgi:regulator of RNase E activity RraA